jgi:hypothetical protein
MERGKSMPLMEIWIILSGRCLGLAALRLKATRGHGDAAFTLPFHIRTFQSCQVLLQKALLSFLITVRWIAPSPHHYDSSQG